MPITVPTATEYARLPYQRRADIVNALRDLLVRYAETEKETR